MSPSSLVIRRAFMQVKYCTSTTTITTIARGSLKPLGSGTTTSTSINPIALGRRLFHNTSTKRQHQAKPQTANNYQATIASGKPTITTRSNNYPAIMTTAVFKHIDTSAQPAGSKSWAKVDADVTSFRLLSHQRSVHDLRSSSSSPAPSESAQSFTTDNCGFSVHRSPAREKAFDDDASVRGGYYAEVEAALRRHLPSGDRVRKVVVFDHTIRRRLPDSARAPVQQVHVDQTPAAAEVRVRRHLPAAEAEELLRGRYQIVNVWRPIAHAASDFPLAVIDWRTTDPEDFVPVDLLYPVHHPHPHNGSTAEEEEEGTKEVRPPDSTLHSTEGYEVKGETMAVAPNGRHRFYYQKDMSPDEVLFLKCYDSFGEGQPLGRKGVAVRTPHTAFVDPQTPADAPPRQSIEVRCLVFYDDE